MPDRTLWHRAPPTVKRHMPDRTLGRISFLRTGTDVLIDPPLIAALCPLIGLPLIDTSLLALRSLTREVVARRCLPGHALIVFAVIVSVAVQQTWPPFAVGVIVSAAFIRQSWEYFAIRAVGSIFTCTDRWFERGPIFTLFPKRGLRDRKMGASHATHNFRGRVGDFTRVGFGNFRGGI